MNAYYLVVGFGALIVVAGIVLVGIKRDESGAIVLEYKDLKAKNLTPAVFVFVVGAAMVVYGAQQLQAVPNTDIKPGVVQRVEDVPPMPDLALEPDENSQMLALAVWARELFDASVWVDVGRSRGVSQGDLLAAVRRDRLPDEAIQNLDLGALADESAATLKVVTVYDEQSVSQLGDIAIESFFSRIPDDTAPGTEVFPVTTDHAIFPIPAPEAVAYNRQLQLEESALEAGLSEDIRQDRLGTAYRAAVGFLGAYPNSFFAPDALFSRAYLAWNRGRMDEALETFDEFTRRYPRNASADGARNWIERIQAGETPE